MGLEDVSYEQLRSEMAKRRAQKRWAGTTPEERSKIASELNAARWGKKKTAAKKATKKVPAKKTKGGGSQ
jgi:hypothetical protein